MSVMGFRPFPLIAAGCHKYRAVCVYLSHSAMTYGEYNHPAPPGRVSRLGLPLKQFSLVPHSQCRLAAQSWVDGFPNLRFFRYAIVPLMVSLRSKPNDAKVTFFTSLILFFTGLPKPDSQNARVPPLDEKRHFWTRGKSRSYGHK